MAALNIKGLLQRHDSLKRLRQPWYPLYQAISQFVLLRKQYFTSEQTDGPFLLNNVYDSTALHAVHMFACSILGQIWPSPFESFEFVPQIAADEAAYSDAFEMMTTVNEVMPINLSLPEAGVMMGMLEAIMDLAAYGTAATLTIQTNDIRCPIKFKAMDAKTLGFSENEEGNVDSVYIEKKFTIAKLVQRYGYQAVSERSRKLYDTAKLEDEVKVLHVIEPRRERNPLLLGTLDMPYASLHIEMDQQHLLQESGFNEMPVNVVRFWRNVGELPGRSPAMDALPDIRALNKLVEMFEKMGEMALDPPKMISTEDVLGAGKIPWYPGVNIPVHRTNRTNGDIAPITPIHVVQNPGWAIQRITDLRDNIMTYFMHDKLSDLNNRSRQTLGEAHIRNEMRMFMTGPILSRILVEMVSPFLDRAFNILLEAGNFGVIRNSKQDFLYQANGIQPKYISEDFIRYRGGGLKGYRINFISPAARLMKLEESQGVEAFTDYAIKVSGLDPSAVQSTINFEEALRAKQRLSGASQKIVYSPAETERRKQAQAAQAAEMQDMQSAVAGGAAFKDVAKGVKDIGGAAAS